MPHPIEEAILDKSLTDDEVYKIIMDSPDDIPERGNKSQEEWAREINAFEELLEHLRNLADRHRPNVLLRIEKETIEQHRNCCGDGKTC